MTEKKDQIYRFINACLANGFDPIEFMKDGRGVPLGMVEQALTEAFDIGKVVKWDKESEIADVTTELMTDIHNLYERGALHPEEREDVNVELSLRNGFIGVGVTQLAVTLKHLMLPVFLQYSLRNKTKFEQVSKLTDQLVDLMDYIIDTIQAAVESDGAVQQRPPEEVERILKGLSEENSKDSDGWEYRIE